MCEIASLRYVYISVQLLYAVLDCSNKMHSKELLLHVLAHWPCVTKAYLPCILKPAFHVLVMNSYLHTVLNDIYVLKCGPHIDEYGSYWNSELARVSSLQ